MRVGVIRGDLPGPIFLADLEPVSRYNPPTEPRGQERYISRPTTAEIEEALADATTGAGACINGIGDLAGAFPITITNGVDDNLRFRLAPTPAPFVDVDIAAAVYANITDLIAAVNTALANAGVAVTAFLSVSPGGAEQRITFESDTKGVDSFVELDSVAGGSTANAPLLTPDGQIRTMAAAADFITDCLPVGGPLDVSTATLNAVGALGTNLLSLLYIPTARGTHEAVADAIAPQFVETPVAIDSFLVGNMADLLSANFTPDSRRMPPLATGPAIEVVEDDGSTPFAATLPTIATSTLNSPGAGDVTIAGTGLGDPERNETVIKYTGDVETVISQQVLEAAGGTVSDTAIVIPAALIPGAATTTTSNQVKVRQRVSAVDALV
jgi:hypothetical protein